MAMGARRAHKFNFSYTRLWVVLIRVFYPYYILYALPYNS